MNSEKNIDEILERYITTAANEDVEQHCNQMFQRLQSRAAHTAYPEPRPRHTYWQRMVLAAVAAAVVLAAGLWWRTDAPAVATNVDGMLIRTVGGNEQPVGVGRPIQWGESIQTSKGATFKLADGSRVEMSAKSEVTLEQAEDGVRILLTEGNVIVNAAKQPAGRHLYVQTKDVTVSVVGTVFLVKAEEQGSRVAVIEGVVQVRQGATEKTLHPGDQIRTNPSMDLKPMVKELEWSRSAPEHVALLQQTSSLTETHSGQETRVAFEVVSIRPGVPTPPQSGGRGGPATPSACGGAFQSGSPLELDPRHLFASNATAFRLITLAYGRNCRTTSVTNLLSGPEWIRTEQFDIQAVVPEGTAVYSVKQLNDGEAPTLQAMLQTMLVQRFNLSMHRETRDIPVFNLVVAKPGKVKLSEDQSPPVPIDRSKILSRLRAADPAQLKVTTPASGQTPRGGLLFHIDPSAGKVVIAATAIPLSEFLDMLVQGEQGRFIIDKTGLDGLIDIPYQVLDVGPFEVGGNSASIIPAVLSQLGLKLEPARGPAEFLVIDRIERPSAN